VKQTEGIFLVDNGKCLIFDIIFI